MFPDPRSLIRAANQLWSEAIQGDEGALYMRFSQRSSGAALLEPLFWSRFSGAALLSL